MTSRIYPEALVIGVDPGPTPGVVALWCEGSAIVNAWIAQCSAEMTPFILNALVRVARDQVDARVVRLAIEAFVVSYRSGRSATPKAGRITRDMIGLLTGWAAGHGIPCHTRSAVTVKAWATDTRLKAAGLIEETKGMPHARDAARHALYEGVHESIIPDPLSNKSV